MEPTTREPAIEPSVNAVVLSVVNIALPANVVKVAFGATPTAYAAAKDNARGIKFPSIYSFFIESGIKKESTSHHE